MGPTSLTWRGLTAATGQDAPWRLTSIEGWEELPAARYANTPRTQGHGAHPSRVWADERIVTATGFCWTSSDRDALLADFRAAMAFGDGEELLEVTVAGRTLTAGAQLLAARPALLRGEWGIGRFGWLAQWRCPDPRRYGLAVSVSTALPDAGGGLDYPLYQTGFLDYGTPGNPGRVTLTNPGTAPAPVLFAVRGGLEDGFELSAGGQRLTYPVEVPAGQVIEINTGDGTVLVEGTASRRGNLTRADFMQVPAGGLLTVQFTSLGGARDPGALLTATTAETHW